MPGRLSPVVDAVGRMTSQGQDQHHARRAPWTQAHGTCAVGRLSDDYRSTVVTTLVTTGRRGVEEKPKRQGGSTGANASRS